MEVVKLSGAFIINETRGIIVDILNSENHGEE
jgi:hypothetical protein